MEHSAWNSKIMKTYRAVIQWLKLLVLTFSLGYRGLRSWQWQTQAQEFRGQRSRELRGWWLWLEKETLERLAGELCSL